ncbi:MAG: hypothetical protein IT462_02640 [Planctomycetes bacterium]|nr:hypothetical protein [Planctomycetota bacterium]
MTDLPANPKDDGKLTDEQIAALLKPDTAKPGKKKRDDKAPSARFPEALYMYLFTVFAGLVLLGIWGYMLRGVEEVMSRGPRQNSPLTEHLLFNLRSTWEGFLDQLKQRPYIPIGIVLGCLALFVPQTTHGRKRMMQLLSALIVAAFAALIAMQFTSEMRILTTPRI